MRHLFVRRKNVRNVGLSLLFTGLGVLILQKFFPISLIAASITIIAAHEFGHWYAALLRGGQPQPPIIVPLGIVSLGVTRIPILPHLSSRSKRYIIAAGPIAGVLAAFSLFPFAFLIGGGVLALSILGLLVLEIYSGIFGLDGQRWRKERAHHGVT